MPTPEQVRAAVDAYVDAYQRGDRDAFLDAFADDGVVIDPVGMPPSAGREARGAFWDMVHGMAENLRFEVKHVHVCASEAAMVFEIHAGGGEDGAGGMIIDAVDIFEVGDDGRITQVKAYWEMEKARTA
jgi:steroid delta-isomerase